MFKGGGVQECVLALYEELTKRGHNVKIITPLPRDYDGIVPDHIITIGTSANVRAFFGTQMQFSGTVDTEAIDAMLSRENFDLIHFHEPWVPVLSRQLISRSKAINVATMHARLPDKIASKTIAEIFTPYVKAVLRHVVAYTAVSQPATHFIGGLTHKKIIIIPNGIDINKYTNGHSRKPSAKKKILYIGRLEKRKGVRYLIDAFAVIAEKYNDVELLIVGSGPEENNLRQRVDDYELSNVEFLGHVDDDQKIELLHTADVFCSPARFGESFGIVLLEAMACRLPIVAGDNPGYESVLVGPGKLSLVDVRSENDLARRLEIFIFEDEIRKTWLKWSDEYVKQFDYSIIVDKYEALYKKLYEKHAK
jgi:phosphatidylinositol alpha-mannosyltransferase